MPATQRERLWLVGGALVALVLTMIGWFFFISPQNAQTAEVRGQVSEADSRNDLLQRRIALLASQNKNLATYQQKLAQAKLALPDTSGLPDFLRSLQSLGNATLAEVTSLTVGPPTDLTRRGAAPAPSATASSGAASSGAGSGASGAASTGEAAAQKVYALPITAQVNGSPSQLAQFLTQLQSVQPRAVLISSITLGSQGTSGKDTGTSVLNLTMKAFVAPASAAESAALSAAAR